MNIRTSKRLGWVVCALLLAIIVGCQSVGGLNLNDMLLKQLDVAQQEQALSLELEIEVNEALLALEDEEARKAVELFRKIKLDITHAKVDDRGNQWVTGVLGTSKGSIPFTLHSDNKAIRIDVDGAKRPLVLELPDLGEALGALGVGAGENGDVQQALMESVRGLVKTIAPYFVNGLPNPPVITVDRVNEPIRGVQTSLTKVHAELNGEQLGELIPVYLENLIGDKEGFKAVIVGLFEWVRDLPPELKSAFGVPPLDAEGIDIDAIAEGASEGLFSGLEDAVASLKELQEQDEWKRIFDKGITLKTDLYVDDSLHIRKSFFEAVIAPAAFAEENSPVRSIKVRASSENWNVNGNVEVPAVEVPLTALSVEELDDYDAYRVVRLFETDSVLYDLLKNEFKIDDQSFELSSEWGIPFYVDENGEAFVPLRETLRKLGIRPKLDTSSNGPLEIRFYDRPTDQSIVLRKDSDQATVNGEAVKLAHPLVNEANITYVSAKDLFDLLGAEYDVVELEYGELVLQVARDL